MATTTALIAPADLADVVVAATQIHPELYQFNSYGTLLCNVDGCRRGATRVFAYAHNTECAILGDCGDHDDEWLAARLTRWLEDARAEDADRRAYPEAFSELKPGLWITYSFQPFGA